MSSAPQIRVLLEQLNAERQRGKSYRLTLTLTVVSLIGVFLGNLYLELQNFDSELLLIHLEQRASTTVMPRYERELRAVAEDAYPAIAEALTEEANKLLPKVSERLGQEGQIFQRNMSRAIEVSLTQHFDRAIAGHEQDFRARFPDFDDRPEVYEQLLRRLEVSARAWAQHRLDTTFEQHVLILQSINETVQRLMLESNDEKAGASSMNDVLSLMAEILNTRMIEDK